VDRTSGSQCETGRPIGYFACSDSLPFIQPPGGATSDPLVDVTTSLPSDMSPIYFFFFPSLTAEIAQLLVLLIYSLRLMKSAILSFFRQISGAVKKLSYPYLFATYG